MSDRWHIALTESRCEREHRHLIEAINEDLPVFPNGNVSHETECCCKSVDLGRTMIADMWAEVCMTCGSLQYWKQTNNRSNN